MGRDEVAFGRDLESDGGAVAGVGGDVPVSAGVDSKDEPMSATMYDRKLIRVWEGDIG